MASCSSGMQTRSRSSSTTKDVVRNTKKKRQSCDSQERVTRSKALKAQELVVPLGLYNYIQEALALEKQIKANLGDKDLKSKLTFVMSRIDVLATIFKADDDLPSDWKYDPTTATFCVPNNSPQIISKKKKKKKKTPNIPQRNPLSLCVPMDELWRKAWLRFKKFDKAARIIPLRGVTYLTVEQNKNPVEQDCELVTFLGPFAIDVFNRSYQMYINKANEKNIRDAVFMDCQYLKFQTYYLFYVTLEAIEQGNLGVYQTTIQCNVDDATITLDTFLLKVDAQPSGTREGANFNREFKYETLQDGLPDPEPYCDYTGMARRRTKGGGYNYYNPYGRNRWMGWRSSY